MNAASRLSKRQIHECFPALAERYELSGNKAIGEDSGFGAVWRARDRWLGRDVALKISDRDLSDELCLCRDIEGQTVRIFDYFRAEKGWNAYAMELLESPWISLSRFIEKHRYKANDIQHYFDSFEIARSVLNGLTHIHGRPYSRAGRYIHADIKPDNLFVMLRPKKRPDTVFRMPASGEMVKIIDMGISAENGTPLLICNTRCSPPDTVRARPGVDLYALAMSFLNLLCGTPPDHYTLGHKARIRAFVAQRSSGSAFLDRVAVDFANHCARSASQPAFSARKLLVVLDERLFAGPDIYLIVLRALRERNAGGTKIVLADLLFEAFAAYYGWQNRTELRIEYIKDVIKEMYDNEMLVRSGHSYSCA